MSRATSTLRGSLRAVAIAITIISIITFTTMGYSIYREYETLSSSGALQGIRSSGQIRGTSVVFSVSGSIPNKGLYPIDLSFSMDAESGGQVLARNTTTTARLLPGENRVVNLTSQINLLSLTNVTNPQRFILNQSVISLFTTLNAGLEPFASISIGTPNNITLPPLMGNFKVGATTVTNQGTLSLVSFPISFVNGGNFQYPFSMHGQLSSGGSVLGSSSTVNGTVTPGQQASLIIAISVPTAQLKPGTYQLTLQVTILNDMIPINLTVEVP